MKISLAIMSVPSRAAHVATMVSRLDEQLTAARAAGYDVVGTTVFEDTHHKGPWHGWRGAWEAHRAHGSTHHVVLQDDVTFCADLPTTLHLLAEARPTDIVSGFLPRKSVSHAHDVGLRWVRTKRFLWAQCVMMPTALGDAALTWIDAQEGTPAAADWKQHDDVRLGAYLLAHRRQVFVPVPHPVEHVGDAIGGSVMGHNGPAARRRARIWLGKDGFGSLIRWADLAYVGE